MKKFILLNVIFSSISVYSQDMQKSLSKFDFELYGDFFINGSFINQPSHKISDILYSYNRTNEFAINLIYLKTSYKDTNFRFNLALMSGTYADDNYIDETELFKNLLEGNVGFKLSKKTNTWLDIGVFPSHIGFESAIGHDCWNISRSLLAENSPYFETGIKLTHTSKNEKFSQTYLILNGWQRITMIPGHSIPAIGLQYTYKPHDKLLMNYSNFIGSYRADSNAALRVYNNLYAVYNFNDKLSALINFDLGIDKNSQENYALWYGGNTSLRYQLNKKNTISWRGEFITDPSDVLYPQFQFNWLTWSSSFNWDKRLNSFSLLRAEIKYMHSDQNIFFPNHNTHLGAFLALQIKI